MNTEKENKDKLQTLKAVYCYYFPEIRKLIDKINQDYPHEMFLTSSEVNLDEFHKPIMEKLTGFYSEAVPALKDFKFSYPTSGSSEGIREYLTLLQSQGTKFIYVLKGEYEGFKETAKTRNIETIEVNLDDLLNAENAETQGKPNVLAELEKGTWFISNPSAINGNIIPNEVINRICDSGHKVFYDLAYLGSTKQNEFDLSHKNIEAAVVSLSKSFGLFRYRSGFTFSKKEISSLYSNKWFKSIPALMIAEKVFDELDINQLYEKYRPKQQQIIDYLNEQFGIGMKPSDALLLGYLTQNQAEGLSEEKLKLIEPFKRYPGYRFCLTPYYEINEVNSRMKK